MKFLVVGTGRNGTRSASMILSALPDVKCMHEPFRPRLGHESDVLHIARDLIENDTPIYGHSSHLIMPILEHLVELTKCHVVHIRRDREETVNSWMRHNGCVSGFVRNRPARIESMSVCYPQFDTDDPRESFGLWWDRCEKIVADIDVLGVPIHQMDISDLNSEAELEALADFLEIPSPRSWPMVKKWDVRWGASIEELPSDFGVDLI